MRCVVSCGSTSFPWLAFFYGALLWGSMIHKHTVRWMWQGSGSVVSWSWEKCSCQSKLVSWVQSLVITLPKKGNLQQCQNYQKDKPHQSPMQSHAEDHTEQIEATSGEDHRRRTGRLQSRTEYYRANLQPTHSMWEISQAPARPLPCLHRLQEGLRQSLACSFVGNHEEVQHQHKPYPSNQKPLLQGH